MKPCVSKNAVARRVTNPRSDPFTRPSK
jgi:hypothetical protein